MRWLVFSTLVLISLGCRQSATSFDPFSTYGPALIPPPPTGTAGRPDPYYRRSANENRQNGSLTLFTSEGQSAGVAVADRRGLIEPASTGDEGVQWRTPDASIEPTSTSPNAATPRPRLPADRRLGRATIKANDEPFILRPRISETAREMGGADRLLSPQAVTPAAYQTPVQPASGWKSRY